MLVVGISSTGKIRSMTAFFIADRKAGVFMLVGFFTAVIIGGSSTTGLAGLGYEMGLVGAWWLLVSVPGLVALALVFSNRIRETDAYTLPEIMRRQYANMVEGMSLWPPPC